MPTTKTRCSKNYINCRKHPARTSAPATRFRADFKNQYEEAQKEYHKAKQAVEHISEQTNPNVKNKLYTSLYEAEIKMIASTPKNIFESFKKDPKWWSKETKMLPTDFREITATRVDLENTINENIEKEDWYSQPHTLTPFQESVSSLLVEEGHFVKRNSSSWGDSRGYPDYAAANHLRTCGVSGISNYEENASWREYDTFSEENKIGIKAEVSCKCSQEFKKPVYLEASTMGSLISRLMNR